MEQEKKVNGVNTYQLFNTIEEVKENADVALFKFRLHNTWIDGTHSRATVKNFYGALQEDTSRRELLIEIDEPPVLCGRNRGANPVEYLLAGLSGCLTTSLVAHAAARGIAIQKVESRYEGDIDLRGFLGLSEDVPVGFKTIRVYFKIDADIDQNKKEELVRMAQKYSPVYNTIASPVPVTVELDTK